MNYNELKTAIAEVIKTNGNEEITGEVMQYILLEMVSSLGKDFQFAGVGSVATDVGEPDENKFWLLPSGRYTNFGEPFDVAENEFAVVTYKGSLAVTKIPVGCVVDSAITENGQNPVKGGAIYEALEELRESKQDNLTWDNAPREGSEHAIYSGAVYEAIKNFITKAVNDLTYYYTKSQTYTKSEVDTLIAAIKQFRIIAVTELPQASADTMGAIYLVPAENATSEDAKDEYVTVIVMQGGFITYDWEKIGTTEIDLSNYPTFEEMNEAIAQALSDYYTKAQVNALVAAAVGSVADLSITAEQKIILTDTATIINLTGRVQVSAESLTISRDGNEVATGSGKVIVGTDNVNIPTAGTLTYLLTAVIGGVERTEEFTIDVVDAVYYGAGVEVTDITTKATVRKTPAGRYSMVATHGDNFFVLCPSGMSIQGMHMNGIDLPVESATGVLVDGKSYLCYKSSNAYEAGTYIIEVY